MDVTAITPGGSATLAQAFTYVGDDITVVTPARRYRLRARSFVLAGGGVGTTRIMLGHQQQRPLAFGGKQGALGRFYMGHLSGKIASIMLDTPDEAGHFDFFRAADGIYARRRLVLDAETQLKEKLLNVSFWFDNPPFYDAAHHSGILSAIFLMLSLPPVGRSLLSEAVRLAHLGAGPRRYSAHLSNLARAPHRTVAAAAEIIRDRFLARPPKPGFLVRNKGGRYALHFHAEQNPNAESRIRLAAGNEGADELPRLTLDLRYSRADADSVARSHALVDAALRSSRRGRLEYWYPPAELHGRILDQASGGFHQIGTTRMSRDPKDGVVDENLRVHGTRNLFVASSSVFPTSGQANPTFLAVALGIRLARHMADELTKAPVTRAGAR